MAIVYEDFIYSCYNSRGAKRTCFELYYRDTTAYSANTAFQKYMRIDMSENRFEIPCIFKYVLNTSLLHNITSSPSIDEVYAPLISSVTIPEQCKSANPLLKSFFIENTSGTLLSKRKCGDTYYIGGEGIIFYEDLTPLVMFTLEVEKVMDEHNRRKYAPIRQIVRINPEIYNRSDLMAKHIRTTMLGKIIPMKMDWGTMDGSSYWNRRKQLFNMNSIFTTEKVNWDFKIIIDDFSEWFVTPAIPDCTFTSSKANEFLLANIDKIL